MPKNLLKELYLKAKQGNTDFTSINRIIPDIDKIAKNVFKQKGVYTVIITLGIYKILNPSQDIRNHKASLPQGFSGRTFDTKYITPTLMELGLPHMAESGWLTRSIEQAHPFNKSFPGKILVVKDEFLNIVDYIQNNPLKVKTLLIYFLAKVIEENNKNIVKIIPICNPDKITILEIIGMLKTHFETDYHTHNASKLPVIAFYSIYEILIKELKRFNKCSLETLGSHTASDRTSGQTGDIQIFENDEPFEAIEIKLGISIGEQIVSRAIEKIYKTKTLHRYYILSSKGLIEEERDVMYKKIQEVQEKHGCQIILNGLYPTLKYYLRLISDLGLFLERYGQNISEDTEIQPIHKTTWNTIISSLYKK